MPDKIVNHFVLADGSIAKYSADQLAGDIPEVVGIRTGQNGIVYASAGDAVRGQIGNTRETIDKYIGTSKKLLDVIFEQGGISNGSGENITSGYTYRARSTDYYTVNEKTNISVASGFIVTVFEYSENNVYSGTPHAFASGVYVLEKGTKYRFVVSKTPDVTTENADVWLFSHAVFIVENPILRKTIQPLETYNGKYYSDTGTLETAGNLLEVAYLLPVRMGETVTVKNAGVYSVRNIVKFDRNKTFVGAVDVPHNVATTTVDIYNDGTFSYIGVGTRFDYDFSAFYTNSYSGLADNYKYDDAVANYIDTSGFMPSQDEYINGLLSSDGFTIVPNDDYRVSPYVIVSEMCTIFIQNIWCYDRTQICFYDENKNLISRQTGNNGLVAVCRFTTPAGCCYIRYTMPASSVHVNNGYYAKPLERHHMTHELVDGWYKDAYRKNIKLFANTTKNPIITFIDDDTVSLDHVRRYKQWCDNAGIKGCYSVITQNLSTITGLTDELLSYEREGFQCVVHCYTQQDFYTPANRNLVSCEDDIVHALHDFASHPFANYKYWVTPYGVRDTDIVNLARKWGFKCLVSSGGNGYESTKAEHGRWGLERVTLPPSDADGLSMTEIKAILDDAYANNGWVLITTHTYESGWDNNESRFRELVDYAKTKGFEIRSLGDAFSIWEPVYKYYEQF